MPDDAGRTSEGRAGIGRGRSRVLQAIGSTLPKLDTPAGKFGPAELASYLRENFEYDPLGFVEFAYPWGEAGTPLANETGPDKWQKQFLRDIGRDLAAGGEHGAIIMQACKAAHGVGKTALIGWICDWGISTHPYTRGTVSAMTEPQLRTKTWAEVAKWHQMCITAPVFRISGRELTLNIKDQAKLRTWRFDAVAWNKADPSAFAGLHNKGRRVIIVYDECAEIVDPIWEVSEGALTDADTQILWLVFGQPLRTNGRFYHCFQPKTRWRTYTVSGVESKFTNKSLIESWKKEYGEDSDFYRVRALGQFPRFGLNNFISPETVMNAQNRMHHPNAIERYPKIMGLDPAAFGDNFSVLTIRQGPAIIFQKAWSGLDGPDLASRVVDEWHRHRNTVECVVDRIGIGQSVCDALARVPGFPLTPCNVSLPASEEATYHNLRAQLWGKMRKWLEDQGSIPANDDDLAQQLCSVDYGFDGKSRYQMQAKQDMKEQGKKSPDKADSLALTFVPDSILRVPARMAHARTVERRVRVL
jgi:hypothetical protein